MARIVANVYRFQNIPHPDVTGKRWHERARALGLRGTILIATEGANIAVAGETASVESFLNELHAELPFDVTSVKRMPVADGDEPFRRMLLKVKDEIVTTGGWEADPQLNAGTFVNPEAFHRMAEDPNVIFVDTRNEYETRVGTFAGALTLPLEGFSGLKEKLPELERYKDKTIVTFCTGGIRCEKAVPMMRAHGFENVKQLEGGILNYLEQYPDGLWEGECFVFDDRCTVTTKLERGSYVLCKECGQARRAEVCENCGARAVEG